MKYIICLSNDRKFQNENNVIVYNGPINDLLIYSMPNVYYVVPITIDGIPTINMNCFPDLNAEIQNNMLFMTTGSSFYIQKNNINFICVVVVDKPNIEYWCLLSAKNLLLKLNDDSISTIVLPFLYRYAKHYINNVNDAIASDECYDFYPDGVDMYITSVHSL